MPERPRANGRVGSGEAGGGAERKQSEESDLRGSGTKQLQTLLMAVRAAPGLPAHNCPEHPPRPLLHSVQYALLRKTCTGMGTGVGGEEGRDR